jgi:hypothetical protein
MKCANSGKVATRFDRVTSERNGGRAGGSSRLGRFATVSRPRPTGRSGRRRNDAGDIVRVNIADRPQIDEARLRRWTFRFHCDHPQPQSKVSHHGLGFRIEKQTDEVTDRRYSPWAGQRLPRVKPHILVEILCLSACSKCRR